MRPAEIEVRFYDTYYFANVAKNILGDPLAYIRRLHDFCGDDREFGFVQPFPRFSALHAFLEFVIDDLLSETSDIDLERRQSRWKRFRETPSVLEGDPSLLPLNLAMKHYQIDHTPFLEWLKESGKSFATADDDDVYEYYSELRLDGSFSALLDRAVSEAFYITFANRRLLLNLNLMLSRQIEGKDLDEVPEDCLNCFAANGMLRRYPLPQWVKDAVFFRDRGRCVFCRRDLSGLITVGSDKNFDHVVPLAQGGLNDVTNIQLLCDECNARKGHGEAVTSDFYQAWYDLEPAHES
jgi:hypothetical protein